ncbi:hypothetical protein [Aeromicrobium sp. UC242_57]|uniref:hypothetical protein n=1 Tax=Aeromicrobium sp. UC242_57 TaxID=3374624 RepID=UPI0037ABC96E
MAEADGLIYSGRAGEAVRLLDGLTGHRELPSAVTSMLATSRAHATALLGRTDEAITIATTAHGRSCRRSSRACRERGASTW